MNLKHTGRDSKASRNHTDEPFHIPYSLLELAMGILQLMHKKGMIGIDRAARRVLVLVRPSCHPVVLQLIRCGII